MKLHDDGIWVIKNFLSEADQKFLVENFEKFNKEWWWRSEENDYSFMRGKLLPLHAIMDEDVDKKYFEVLRNIDKKIESVFINYTSITDMSTIHRFTKQVMGPHKDNENEKSLDVIFGAVLYINDNYEGGEIAYFGDNTDGHEKELYFSYKPNAGDLVIHRAGILHGPLEVVSGVRYFTTAFIRGNKDTKYIEEMEL